MSAFDPKSPNPQFLLGPLGEKLTAAVDEWSAQAGARIARLWQRDASLWTGGDEARWLGWLDIVDRQRAAPQAILRLADDLRHAGLQHAVVLGMGGSSLGPDVLRATFGPQPGCPALSVLDSMVPAQVAAALEPLDLARTVFLVASKSGSTIEPNVLKQYCWDQTLRVVGPERVAAHFVAITDPDTKMDQLAQREHFRRIVYGDPTIGGRFSALSPFGLTPAAIMGLDLVGLLDRAAAMVERCRCPRADENPGVSLGLALGTLWQAGRDKLTVLASPEIGLLGAWLEQLVAESTGKHDRGIVPVDDEPRLPAGHYASDRVFCYLRLADGDNRQLDALAAELAAAGQPLVVLPLAERLELGAEFFRWEIATAVAGAVLGINPFDQPDVEAAKVIARQVTAQFESTGRLPVEPPTWAGQGVEIFVPPAYAQRLAAASARSPAAVLAGHLATLAPGDYFAINAFLEMSPEHQRLLQSLRRRVLEKHRVATTLGFGPRFLHSTGQLHKGGPNRGVFLELTSADQRDLPIPGQKFSFGVLKAAQAQGDYAVLAERGRRIMRLHLGANVAEELARLDRWIAEALA